MSPTTILLKYYPSYPSNTSFLEFKTYISPLDQTLPFKHETSLTQYMNCYVSFYFILRLKIDLQFFNS